MRGLVLGILLTSFALAGADEFEKFLMDVKEIKPFGLRKEKEGGEIAKAQIRNLASVQTYCRNSVHLAARNEFDYLELYWLKAKDPMKRLSIGSVLLVQYRNDTDVLAELKSLAIRFDDAEREERIAELQWISKNRIPLAKIFLEKIREEEQIDHFRKSLKNTVIKFK